MNELPFDYEEWVGQSLTERDFEIIRGIYLCRTMTTDQIRRTWFPNSKWHVYNRLRVLKKHGYLTTLPYVKNGKKIGTCYYVTDKGAEEIGIENPRNFRKNMAPHLHDYRIALAEIFVHLYGTAWKWIDPHEAKLKYRLNQHNRFDGMICNGEDYLTYLLSRNPKPRTIAAVKDEIAAIKVSLRRFIVFFQDKKVKERFGSDYLGAYRLMLLEHPWGLKILKKLADPKALLAAPGLNLDGRPVKQADEPFADFLVDDCYLAEFLTNDLAKLYYLKNYGPENGRRVLALVFEDDLDYYRSEFKGYRHVKFVPVPKSWVEEEK